MNLHIQCPINSLGYGVASFNIVKALDAAGHDVVLWPIGNPQPEKQEDVPLLQKLIAKQHGVIDLKAPSIRIFHQNSLAQHIGRGQTVGFPFFELNQFNPVEKCHLESQDGIFVSSEWAKEIILNELPDGEFGFVEVIPLGVDRTIFYDKIDESQKDGSTVFLNVGKWEVRKGHDILIEAFNAAFGPNDKVELWMMNDNPFLRPPYEQTDKNEEWIKLYKESKLGDKITILPRVQTQAELAEIMRRADCGVFPARAEGWNLEALEMLSCGKQVIATNYAAHTEFLEPHNSLLIHIDELEDAYDGKWFHGFGQWANLGEKQFEQLVDKMRIVHAVKCHNIAGVETSKRFSWENTANKIVEVLDF